MKKIKSFEGFINEAELINIPTDPILIKKEAEKTIASIEKISMAIVNAKELKSKVKEFRKENAELAKNFEGYFKMAKDSSELIKKVKAKGISKNTRKSGDQLRALIGMEKKLRAAHKHFKDIDKRTEGSFEQNEGILNIVGNVLKNLLTGDFIVNLVKNVKQNLKDSYTDMHRVEDVFSVHDY